MKLIDIRKSLGRLMVGVSILLPGVLASAQTPTPVATAITAPTEDPSLPELNDPMTRALEPVREAIGRQDYPGAQTALDAVKRNYPDNPSIALYQSLIQRRQTKGQVLNSESPLRTPRAGVTPIPTPQATPTPTPAPTPVADTAAAESNQPAATNDYMAKVKNLWANDTVKYGVYGVLGLIVLIIIIMLFKKSRGSAGKSVDTSELETPPGGVTTIGGMDDQFGTASGSSNEFSALGNTEPAPGSVPDFNPTPDQSPAGGGMGGSSLAGGAAGFTVPGFDDDEEEQTPPPKRRMPPKQKEPEEDPFVNLFGDDDISEPPSTPEPPIAPEPPAHDKAPKAAAPPPEDVSFQSMDSGSEPFDDEETLAVPPPEPPSSGGDSPSPTPTGTVDLEDIFGSQPLPGQADTAPEKSAEQPKSEPTEPMEPEEPEGLHEPVEPTAPSSELEDPNSMTLPTFVSTPEAENPEENVEVPPQTGQRSKPAEESESISLDEMFGPSGEPEVEDAPEPEEKPAPKEQPTKPEPASETSIEDALAATLGAMEAESPEATNTAGPAETGEAAPQSSESLDERTERMFNMQMEKARHAVEEKNWRHAVHILSIASALHPENEETKKMLKDARAEKRKSEESV